MLGLGGGEPGRTIASLIRSSGTTNMLNAATAHWARFADDHFGV
jgi:hypothetical protein